MITVRNTPEPADNDARDAEQRSGDGTLSRMAVVVTGAGSGIGRATARRAARLGARVLAVGRRIDPLRATADGHPAVVPFPVDITHPDAPDRIADAAVDQFGRLDGLVNNAGVLGGGLLAETTRDRTEPVWETNVIAPMLLSRAALPHLVRRNGVIVNVSTSVGQRGWAGSGPYVASKAALESLTRSWSVELAPRGVRVVAVAPGAIDTPIGENNGTPPESQEEISQWQIERTPLGRRGDSTEVAWAIVQLLSPEAGFVTGVVLPVDGGAVVA